MVSYVLGNGADVLYDPAVGAGAFFGAAKRLGLRLGAKFRLAGCELHSQALDQALAGGLSRQDLDQVRIGDFVLDPPGDKLSAIAANPPYIRHHRLSAQVKSRIRRIGVEAVGRPLDGRAGLHVYFLVRALEVLAPGGRLAFILPADTCEGVFARPLWNWISERFRISAVVTFAPKASPFPGVDTNPIIFFIENSAPQERLAWARCLVPASENLAEWVRDGFPMKSVSELDIQARGTVEAMETGLSRSPRVTDARHDVILSQFVRVMRGIATGANEFFFLTAKQVHENGLAPSLLVRAVGRTRDVEGPEITTETLEHLEAMGRPTWLFSPDGRPFEAFPDTVRRYLKRGEEQGLPHRALIAMRRPWYKMEVRAPPPPFLFSYLGRRNSRFVRNLAGVVPLTGFLCIYPRRQDQDYLRRLWSVLDHPMTIANLSLVGKSYGSGAIKVEPRALERLPLPPEVVAAAGLRPGEFQPELTCSGATASMGVA